MGCKKNSLQPVLERDSIVATTFDEMRALRPIDPAELEVMKEELRSQMRAWKLRAVRESQPVAQVEQ
jgi:hypothetical protein